MQSSQVLSGAGWSHLGLRGVVQSGQNNTEFKGLKANDERQDDGAGTLHQVKQFPIGQVYFIYIQGTRAPLHARPRETR